MPARWAGPFPARLKEEITDLKRRLTNQETEFSELPDFKTHALARLAAQHDKITRLRRE